MIRQSLTRVGRMMRAEFLRYGSEVRTYFPDQVTDVAVTALMLVVVIMASGRSSDPALFATVGLWYLSAAVVQEGSISIVTEKNFGTFENLMLMPWGMGSIIAAKTVAWTTVNAAKVAAVMAVLAALLRLPVAVPASALLVLPCALVGVFGLSLLLVALTIQYTKTSSFIGIVSYVLLFLSGSVVPLVELPTVVQWASRALPLTWAVEILQRDIAGQASGWAHWVGLVASSLAMLAGGLVIFVAVMRRSRRRGVNMR